MIAAFLRQLHVHHRLGHAQADAADLDDIGCDAPGGQIRPDRGERLPAPAPSPHVPAPTKITGLATVSRRSIAILLAWESRQDLSS